MTAIESARAQARARTRGAASVRLLGACLGLAVAALVFAGPAAAQRGRGQRPPASPRAAAPIDLTGYWISVVTEDWMFRMVTPPKGQFRGVPLNAAGRRAANAWDPAADEAAGERCRAYGAAALMRIPGRLRISWEDDSTLRVDAEAGSQTRRFHFRAADAARRAGASPETLNADAERGWQGYSVAEWERAAGRAPAGDLKVETTAMKPGYLRKNGVPYSAAAELSEYYNVYDAPDGDTWLVVTTIVTDPAYLTEPFVTSTHFKKIDEETGRRYWKPMPCGR